MPIRKELRREYVRYLVILAATIASFFILELLIAFYVIGLTIAWGVLRFIYDHFDQGRFVVVKDPFALYAFYGIFGTTAIAGGRTYLVPDFMWFCIFIFGILNCIRLTSYLWAKTEREYGQTHIRSELLEGE